MNGKFPDVFYSTQPFRYTLVLLLALAIVSCNPGERRTMPPEIESAIATVSDDIAAERYEKVYTEAADVFRQDATLEQSVATFKTLRTKLGAFESRTLQSAVEQENASGPLKGRVYIVTYRTKFQNGEGMETFTLLERNHSWLLARYFVNSTMLK